MSETKASNLTALVSKKTRRAKERLMQNFGKADKTIDEMFEVYQLNYMRQQSTAQNLQKHLKHYLTCLHQLREASKALNACLVELHEKDWPKHETFENNAHEANHIDEDLEETIKESVMVPLEQYLGQFSEMRDKISKRGRKLVDFDSKRHSFETLQQSQQGKPSDTKLMKNRDQLDEARRVYETLNNELHEELPALYDNRLPFLITIFQRFFASHIAYHSDHLTLSKGYIGSVEELAGATERGVLNSIKTIGSYPSHITSPTSSSNNNDKLMPLAHHLVDKMNGSSGKNLYPAAEPAKLNLDKKKTPALLYKVKASYKYLAEDEDEISFDAGEIIQVIEYEDPSEQEEGWLMGIKESDGQKGLFPANFTKELEPT